MLDEMPSREDIPITQRECNAHMQEVHEMHKETLEAMRSIITNLKGSDDGLIPGLRQEVALIQTKQDNIRKEVSEVHNRLSDHWEAIDELKLDKEAREKVQKILREKAEHDARNKKIAMIGGGVLGSGGIGAFIVWIVQAILSWFEKRGG